MSNSPQESLDDTLLGIQPLVGERRGLARALNIGLVLLCQLISIVLAILLDKHGFPEATIVIVMVLGVLATTILTDGLVYSLLASVISILCYNYFLITPRLSFAIGAQYYLSTITAMFAFALLASYLVASMRSSARQSEEAALMAQREQLRANMLRSVSHDLRTPLTSIIGNTDVLLDDDARLSDEMRRKLIEDIGDDATWLRSMIENLLAVTRFEDGSISLSVEIELIDDVIEEALRHISREARNHHIVVEPSEELMMARMDPQIIVQVIVNLVNNAIVHTQLGSTITISTAREGSMVAVSVTDDGPGISDADKEHVFELFFTAGGADAARGTGMGLALCRSAIEAHGGTIRVEDVQPHGARFVFTLPEEVIPYV